MGFPKFSVRRDAGRVLYLFEDVAFVSSGQRAVPASGTTGEVGASATGGGGMGTPPPGSVEPPVDDEDKPHVVQEHFRLVSAKLLSPGLWFEDGDIPPQWIDFAHNDAAGLRAMVPWIQAAKRPVPVMWGHTHDIQRKAGSLRGPWFEQSADIEPGVNSWVRVDDRFDEKAAVGLRTGELDAGSIGLRPILGVSHPKLNLRDFVTLQGEERDGSTVRWLLDGISAVAHYALEPLGADDDSGPRKTAGFTRQAWPGHVFTEQTGGEGNMDELMGFVAAIIAQLGIQKKLPQDGSLPEGIRTDITECITGMQGSVSDYNTLSRRVGGLAQFVKREGDGTLTNEVVLERVAEELQFAPHGRRYLTDLRESALKAFDTAHFSPEKKELTEIEKRQRKLIEDSIDVQFLLDQNELLGAQADSRFGAVNRQTSSPGALPGEQDKQTAKPPQTPEEIARANRDHRLSAYFSQTKGKDGGE